MSNSYRIKTNILRSHRSLAPFDTSNPNFVLNKSISPVRNNASSTVNHNKNVKTKTTITKSNNSCLKSKSPSVSNKLVS